MAKNSKISPKQAAVKKSKLQLWITGARLRTLPLAVAPVLLGTGVAARSNQLNLVLAGLALAVALLLQIGVNYANDYSDGIRGTDDNRVGPLRLTGSGSTRPQAVKFAAFAFFALAGLAGLIIVLITQLWWLLLVGMVCVIAAWYYTGGKHPYGYAGLGEVSVFVFFGLVATVGTSFIQQGYVDLLAVVLSVAAGCFASAVLMVNNLRDLDNDKKVGKRTLAVKVGAKWAKAFFFILLWLPIVILMPVSFFYGGPMLGFGALLLIVPITLIVEMAKTARELILALKLTSMAGLAFAVLVSIGLFL